MALYKEALDATECSVPGCDHKDHAPGYFLHSKCHTGSPVWVMYLNGNLFVTCSVCKKVVASIAVASIAKEAANAQD